jgi:hypothetical protein
MFGGVNNESVPSKMFIQILQNLEFTHEKFAETKPALAIFHSRMNRPLNQPC